MLTGRSPSFDSSLQRGYKQSVRSLESLQSIWERKLHKLATSKDLIRLCNGMSIQSETGETLFQAEGKGVELAKNILCGLIVNVDPDNYDALEKGINEVLIPERETASALRKLFSEKKNGIEISKTKVGRILRGINQEIVFPVVRELRDTFYEQFPFKDIRGTWKVGLKITSEGYTLSHYKQEQSYSTDNPFSFRWQLDLHFDHDATTFRPEYYISQVNFGETLNRPLQEAMKPYYHRSTQYRNIWTKENKTTMRTIASSLPRVAEGASIIDSDTIVLDQTNHNSEPLTLVRDFLIYLTYYVDPPEVSEHVRSVFEEIMETTDPNTCFDPTKILKRALKNNLLPPTSKSYKILKAVNNDIPMPAVMQLRNHIYPFAKYRDIKGSWNFRIVLAQHQYFVILEKKECSASLLEEEYFDFTWQLIMTFDTDMQNLIDAEFYVTEYSLHTKTNIQFRLWLEKLILPFISESQPPKIVMKNSIPAPDILMSIIKTLRQFPEIPQVYVPGHGSSESMLKLIQVIYEADSRGVAFPAAFLEEREQDTTEQNVE